MGPHLMLRLALSVTSSFEFLERDAGLEDCTLVSWGVASEDRLARK